MGYIGLRPARTDRDDRFRPVPGTCPVCGKDVPDLVSFGEGAGESRPGRGGPPTYHWYILYGDHYSTRGERLCPFQKHPAHCIDQRCDALRTEQVWKSEKEGL